MSRWCVRQDDGQDPGTLRHFKKDGHKDNSFAEFDERSKKRWARIRKEAVEAKRNPPPEPPDDGELSLDLVG